MDPELRAYLDERFDRMDRRFEQVDRRFERGEETARQTFVVAEGLRRELHLVAEAFLGLSERMEEAQRELAKPPTWFDPYFRELDKRIEGVARRVSTLEGYVERRQGDIMDAVRKILGRPPLNPSPAVE
jgi:hypothetical protein